MNTASATSSIESEATSTGSHSMSAATAVARSSGLVVAKVIAQRELVRFLRQPARILAAIGTPVIIWIFMGSGFAHAYQPPTDDAAAAMNYAAYLLPGMMTLVALFTAIFSCISIIEDRQQGWLQSVLVSPAPRWSIAAGKIVGGSTLAFMQAALLLLGAPLISVPLSLGGVALTLVALGLASIAMTGVGVAFAWRSESTQGFHAVMNLVLMPMWLLSGAFFAPEGATAWLRWVMWINPLTWSTEAIRDALVADVDWLALLGTTAFALAAFGAATMVVAQRRKGV